MTPPVCDPIDSYHTVLQCDNSESEQTIVTCRYKKVIGTQYETSWSESMSIDASIEVSMKATIYEIFEMSIGTSITTGYNWGRAGSEVFNEQEEYELTVEVLPGFILQIDQKFLMNKKNMSLQLRCYRDLFCKLIKLLVHVETMMLKLNCSSLLKLMPPEMPLIGSGTKGLSTMVQPFPSMNYLYNQEEGQLTSIQCIWS